MLLLNNNEKKQVDYLNRNNQLKSKKKQIKVLILTSKINKSELAVEYKDSYGNTKYDGFLYNVFKKMKKDLEHKYEFIEEFREIRNYNNELINISKGKYDIAIGGFYNNSKANEYVNFSRPLYLGADSILHVKKKNLMNSLVSIIRKMMKPILFLVCIGILFGIILYFLEPNRNSDLPAVKNSRFSFKRTILTVISAFFGEMGFLTENSELNIPGMLLIIFTMIVSFSLVVLIQARVTTIMVELEKESNIDFSHIEKYTFLGFKGSTATSTLEKEGAKIEYSKKNIYDTVKYYLKNTDKYDGIVISYTEAYSRFINDSNLTISYENTGDGENANINLHLCSWPVSKEKPEFLKDVNEKIIQYRSDRSLREICKSYLPRKEFCI